MMKMPPIDLSSLSTAETCALVRLLLAAMFVDGEAHPSEKALFDAVLRKAAISPDAFESAKSMTLDTAIEVYRRATPPVAQAMGDSLRQMVKVDGVLADEEVRLQRLLGIDN